MTAAPPWLERLARLHATRAGSAFLLYFNVSDLALLDDSSPRRLAEALPDLLAARGFDIVVRYSLSSGIRCPVGAAAVRELAAREGVADLAAAQPEQAIPFLETLLCGAVEQRVAAVVDYVEHLAPAQFADRSTRAIVEALERCAASERLSASSNLLVGLTSNLGAIAPQLVAADSGWVKLKVDLPALDERRRLVDLHEQTETLPRLDGLDRDGLASLSSGFRHIELQRLLRESLAEGGVLRPAALSARRAELIAAESEGLLTVLDARHGFDDVGGHEAVKRYFRSVMRDGRLSERAPRGVLFAGPPGTGKTYLAQAIAAECGMTIASMGSIRSKWVGDSERNLARVLDVVSALAPIVVFVDEVDQALGRRDEGQHGDSGVSGRIFSRIMEFMSDPAHRGQVLWVAATNRPDLLDPALLRRLERVFPFLLPGLAERERILRVIAAREPLSYAADIDWAEVAHRTRGASGAALELVLARAREIAGDGPVALCQMTEALTDYKPNADAATYRAWSRAALNAATFYSDWPTELPEDISEELAAGGA